MFVPAVCVPVRLPAQSKRQTKKRKHCKSSASFFTAKGCPLPRFSGILDRNSSTQIKAVRYEDHLLSFAGPHCGRCIHLHVSYPGSGGKAEGTNRFRLASHHDSAHHLPLSVFDAETDSIRSVHCGSMRLSRFSGRRYPCAETRPVTFYFQIISRRQK